LLSITSNVNIIQKYMFYKLDLGLQQISF